MTRLRMSAIFLTSMVLVACSSSSSPLNSATAESQAESYAASLISHDDQVPSKVARSGSGALSAWSKFSTEISVLQAKGLQIEVKKQSCIPRDDGRTTCTFDFDSSGRNALTVVLHVKKDTSGAQKVEDALRGR